MKYSKKAKAIILACVIVILIAGIRLGSDIRYLQSWLVFGLPCAWAAHILHCGSPRL